MPPKKSAAAPKPKAAPPKTAKKRTKAAANDDNDDDVVNSTPTFLHILPMLNSDAAVISTADVTARLFSSDPDQAMASLVNLICAACGCSVELETWQVSDDSIQSTLEEVFQRVPADAETYMLCNKDAKYKNFRANYGPFWRTLPQRCAHTVMLGLFERLHPWLSAMSDAKARSFRHTATVAMCNLLHSLSEIVDKGRESAMGVAASSRSRSEKSGGGGVERDEAVMKQWQSTVFGFRFRDIHTDIRLYVLNFLQECMTDFPLLYIKEEHLRYQGWAIHDKKPEVRKVALDTLISLYGTQQDLWDRLGRFTERFKDRIVALTRDNDVGCAERALKVAALIVRMDHHQGRLGEAEAMFSNAVLSDMLQAMFDDRQALRVTAGMMFKLMIKLKTNDVAADDRTRKRIEMILKFVTDARVNRGEALAARYVVNALWGDGGSDHTPPSLITSDCDEVVAAMIRLDQPSIVRSGLDLLCATLQRLRGELFLGPIAKDDTRKKLPALKKAQETEYSKLLTHVSEQCPRAIQHAMDVYKAEEGIVTAAAQVMAAMEFTAWGNQRMAKRFVEVVRQLTAMFRTTPNAELHQSVIQLYTNALSEVDYAMKGDVDKEFRALVKDEMKAVESLTQKTSMPVVVGTWRRIYALYSYVDLGDTWQVVKKWLGNMIKRRSSSVAADDDVAGDVAVLGEVLVGCAYRACLWALSIMTNDSSLSESMTSEIQGGADLMCGVLAAFRDVGGKNSSSLIAATLCHVSDLLLLPGITMDGDQRQSLLRAYAKSCEHLHQLHKSATEEGKQADKDDDLSGSVAFRSAALKWEHLILRTTQGVCRLCRFGVLDAPAAALIVQQWTRISSRVTVELLKELFKQVREATFSASGKPHEFEEMVIMQGLQDVVDCGESPAAVDAFQSICVKLAQVHFMPTTDKFYAVVPRVIQSGINKVVESPDTFGVLMLGLAAFAARLRVQDAAKLLSACDGSDFTAVSSAYKGPFFSAVRKAAHMGPVMDDGEEFVSSPAGGGGYSHGKRHRTTSGGYDNDAGNEESEFLVGGPVAPASAAKRGKGKSKSVSAAPVEIAPGGWRTRPDTSPTKPAAKVGGKKAGGKKAQVNDDDDDEDAFASGAQGGATQKGAAAAKKGGGSQRGASASQRKDSSFRLGAEDSEVFVESQLWEE